MRRLVAVVGVLIWSAMHGLVSRGASPPTTSGDEVLTGKAHWDPALWKYYCKHEYGLDVAGEPQAFPQQDALKHLNGEFARRLRAVMVVYQAASGLNDLGLTPQTGGIRTAAEQLEIYKKGRTLKPGATGAHQADYVDPPTDKAAVETYAWVSWHELGLAADLRAFVGGKLKQPEDTPQTLAFFSKTTHAMTDLGMIWGGYWPWDYGHVEWHPSLSGPDAEHLGTPGQPVTDGQMQYGYDWKIPQQIFVWHGAGDNPESSPQDMAAYQLVEKGGWLCLEKDRFIERQKNSLRGRWRTFEPPVRLLPTYSPVTWLALNSHDDAQWNVDTTVSEDAYEETTVNGKKVCEGRTITGKAHLISDIRVRDWQKTATTAQESAGYSLTAPPKELKKSDPKAFDAAMQAYNQAEVERKKRRAETELKFRNVRHSCVYDAEIHLEAPTDAKKESIHTSGRRMNRDGYTEDFDNTADYASPTGPVYLSIAWDRDHGAVGVGMLEMLLDRDHPSLEVRGVYCSDTGHCTLVSAKVPHSMPDIEHPIPWPAANPKPKPEKQKSEPGKFLPR